MMTNEDLQVNSYFPQMYEDCLSKYRICIDCEASASEFGLAV